MKLSHQYRMDDVFVLNRKAVCIEVCAPSILYVYHTWRFEVFCVVKLRFAVHVEKLKDEVCNLCSTTVTK